MNDPRYCHKCGKSTGMKDKQVCHRCIAAKPDEPCRICGDTDCIHLSSKEFVCRSPACENRHNDVDEILCRECRPVDECSEAGIRYVETDNHDEAVLEITLDYKKGHVFLSKEFLDSLSEQAWPGLVSDLPPGVQEEFVRLREVEKIAKEHTERLAEINTQVAGLEQRAVAAEKEAAEAWVAFEEAASQRRIASAERDTAHEKLWEIVDLVLGSPRQGNLYVRMSIAVAIIAGMIEATKDKPEDGCEDKSEDGPNTPYTEANNMYTCPKGHSYSFHTQAGIDLKELGICKGCKKGAG